jgi:hypothetical protein
MQPRCDRHLRASDGAYMAGEVTHSQHGVANMAWCCVKAVRDAYCQAGRLVLPNLTASTCHAVVCAQPTCSMLSVRRMSPPPSVTRASMPPGPSFTLQQQQQQHCLLLLAASTAAPTEHTHANEHTVPCKPCKCLSHSLPVSHGAAYNGRDAQ